MEKVCQRRERESAWERGAEKASERRGKQNLQSAVFRYLRKTKHFKINQITLSAAHGM